MRPSIYTDCNGKCSTVTLGNLSVTFSYTTPVAFQHPRTGSVCSENVWSMTTGKHLNTVETDKKRRVPHNLFESLLDLVCAGDPKSLTKAERLIDTHRALDAAGIKRSA